MVILPVAPTDRAALLRVAVDTALFNESEAESLLGNVLDQLAAGSLPNGHSAVCCRAGASNDVAGWTYFAPDDHAEGVWNVWWIGVTPAQEGTGVAQALLEFDEVRAKAQGARLVVIETSSLESQTRARRPYTKRGYSECGRVPHFYGEDDDKVIFARVLQGV